MESLQSFAARVKEYIGKDVTELPVECVSNGQCMPGKIVAARRDRFVCAVGYPYTNENGEEVFEDFVLVMVK